MPVEIRYNLWVPLPFSSSCVSFRFFSFLFLSNGKGSSHFITLTSLSYISHMSFAGFAAEEEEALPFAC